jgi:hypothetical protein
MRDQIVGRDAELRPSQDAGTLIALWLDLLLPGGVRRAWEECHPALRAAGARNGMQEIWGSTTRQCALPPR